MTANNQGNQEQSVQAASTQAQPDNSKELNFRRQEAMYRRMLEEKEARIAELEKARQVALAPSQDDDDDDTEPYVDKRKLNKFGQNIKQSTQSEIQKAMETAKEMAKEELKRELWLENNPDFYDVLQKAELFAQRAPKLAETILKMPDNFERQKLVYQNIKELGLDKPPQKEASVQQKIDANRRSPYYQPSGVGAAPYAAVGDYSATGQKQAYDKMQELKARLRM